MPGQSIDIFKAALGNPDDMAAEISSLYETWKRKRAGRDETVAEVVQYILATSTEGTGNVQNGHNHSTHRPKLTQIFDNLMANYVTGLIPNDSFFRFDAEDEHSIDRVTKTNIESYLRTKHRQMPGKFRGKIKELVADWLLGDCYAQVSFVNQSHTDPETGEVLQGYQGPVIDRIPYNNIVYNPLATTFADTPKIIRHVKTLGELARDIEERPELGYQREVFDKIVATRSAARGMKERDLNEVIQLTFDGLGSYADYIRGTEVEILEFYGDIFDVEEGVLLKNYSITVFDRMFVARQQALDTYNGKPMIYHARYRARPNSLAGMGALENLLGMQYYINHLENAKADAFDDMLVPDRVISGLVEEVVGENGEITYYVDGAGSVRNLSPDATVLHADFKISELESKMEQYAGAPSEGVGIRSPGEKTKFEVSTLENNRGRFFQHNMHEFESQILEDILNAELYVARKALAGTEDTIRIDDETTGAKLFKSITKKDIMGTGKLLPTGARHFTRIAQLSQNLVQFQQGVLATDQDLKVHFPAIKLARMWEELLEFEQFGLVQEYGRIPEQLEAQRRIAVASRSLEEESDVEIDEDEENEE